MIQCNIDYEVAMKQGTNILLDLKRADRTGISEAIFCENKPSEIIIKLISEYGKSSGIPMLFTRFDEKIYNNLPENLKIEIDYDKKSKTASTGKKPSRKGKVTLISAGTSDSTPLWEAAMTLEYEGLSYNIHEDRGVAGLWRILELLPILEETDVIICAAGFDGALPTVLGGLIKQPLIALPTSIGYGVAKDGAAALSSMLASCSPGITVVNTDNGYGAACAAIRIINSIYR